MTSSARALHDALATLVGNPKPVPAAWADLLDAPYGSQEFTAKHCEFLGLIGEVSSIISALPTDVSDRYSRYLPAWWDALILPTEHWLSTSRSAASIITRPAIDQLASLADIVDTTLAGGPFRPTGSLSDLRAACLDWLDELKVEQAFAEAIRVQLVMQLQNVVWLIDNAHLFGSARAVQAAGAALGTAIQAGPSNNGGRVRQMVARFAAAITIATGSLAVATQAVDQVGQLVDAAEVVWVDLMDGGSKTPELSPAGTQDGQPVSEEGPPG